MKMMKISQFVIFKPLSYCFGEIIGFDIKASFVSRPVSRLIRWYNKRISRKGHSVPRDFSWIENYKLIIKSLYYDINELNGKLNESQSIFKKTFSLMQLNISSLQYHLDKRSDLIDKSKTKLNVIGITESRLNKDIAPLKNINLQNYNI